MCKGKLFCRCAIPTLMYTQSIHLLNFSTYFFLGKLKWWNSVVTGLYFLIYICSYAWSPLYLGLFFHFLSPETKGGCHSWASLQISPFSLLFCGRLWWILFCFETGLLTEKKHGRKSKKTAVGFRCTNNSQSILLKHLACMG